MGDTSRKAYWDIVKGIAIVLVVIGHAIQYVNIEGWTTSYVERSIYIFHMPLFIAVSGYFFYNSAIKNTYFSFICKKGKSILLPSITFGCIILLLKIAGNLLKNRTFSLPEIDNWEYFGLWYLTFLFILCAIGKTFLNWLPRYAECIWLLLIIVSVFNTEIYMGRIFSTLAPYFLLFIVFRKYDFIRLPFIVFATSLCVFAIALYYSSFDYSMYFMSCEADNYILKYILRFVAGLSGVIIVLYLTKYIEKVKIASDYLSRIGKHTLPIYFISTLIFHFYQYVNFHTENIFVCILFGIVVLLASICIYKATRNIRLSVLCYGS